MQINLTGDGFPITPFIHDYVNEKLNNLQSIFNNITNVHVILSVDKHFQQKAKATVHMARKSVFAESESTNIYAAIDELYAKLERQVIDHKEEMNHRPDRRGLE